MYMVLKLAPNAKSHSPLLKLFLETIIILFNFTESSMADWQAWKEKVNDHDCMHNYTKVHVTHMYISYVHTVDAYLHTYNSIIDENII